MSKASGLIWKFSIQYVPRGKRPLRLGSAARLEDFREFRGLYQLFHPELNKPESFAPAEVVEMDVEASDDDPLLQIAIKKLEELGWTPVFQGMAGPDQWDRHYPIMRSRPDYPLDSSNWLRLADAGGDGGEILRMEGDDLVVIARPEWLKKKSHCLNLLWCELAVSQEFKDSFEQAGLTGAVFRPITYVGAAPGFHPRLYPDKPLPPCNRTYWMDSSVVAPWSRSSRWLTMTTSEHPLYGTLLGHTNEPLRGQRGDLFFETEGYSGLGIDYGRREMDAMEGVNYMRMAEWSRERNGVWRSYHIVSQRFRKWAHAFGCRFRMSGVKLVD
jgi:hypothetical protein